MAFPPDRDDDRVVMEEGRKFSAFGLENDISCVPTDEAQDDLFNDYHEFLHANFLETIPPEFPDNEELESPRVLDCGCGTGAWIDYLMDPERDVDNDTYPLAQVVGIDIVHRDIGVEEFVKVRWNLNVSLLIPPVRDMVKRDFNLINSRFLVDGINARRWAPLINEYKDLLTKGGWLQMAELEWTFHSENGHALPNLAAWSDAYSQALRRMGKEPNIAGSLSNLVRSNGGFEQVRGEVHRIRLGGWPSDDGTSASAISFVHGMLASLALFPFTRRLQWPQERREEIVKAAQEELRTPGARIFQKLTVVYGRKPRPSG